MLGREDEISEADGLLINDFERKAATKALNSLIDDIQLFSDVCKKNSSTLKVGQISIALAVTSITAILGATLYRRMKGKSTKEIERNDLITAISYMICTIYARSKGQKINLENIGGMGGLHARIKAALLEVLPDGKLSPTDE